VGTPRHLRITVSSGVVLALIGVWLGHGIEYLRVWGPAGLERALTGVAHAYMVPLGVVLVGVASAVAMRAWSSWQRLALRLDRAACALHLALRGKRPEPRDRAAPSWPSRILLLGLAMAVLQVGLYLLQENVEAMAFGLPAPGFGAITGVHWAAALLQVDIAFLILAAATFVLRRFAARAAVVQRIEALLRLLAAMLRPRSGRAPLPQCQMDPEQWLGRGYAPRAPPLPA